MKRTLVCLSLGATLAFSTALVAQPLNDDMHSSFHSSQEMVDGNGHDHSSSCSSCSGQSYQRAKCGYGQSNEVFNDGRCGVDCGWGKVYKFGIDNNVVDIEKRMSSWIQLDQEFCMQIRAKAYAEAENVVIKTTIPEGSRYVDSDPVAQVVDNELLWQMDKMCCGETRCINVWFKAVAEGNLNSCTSVHVTPTICACTVVGEPDLQMSKEGPKLVVQGERVDYFVTVYNNGTYPAFGVVLKDEIPNGMYHQSGECVLEYDLGTIHPCGSKCITIPLCAESPLKNVCNKATASSCNAGEASDQICIDILRQGIEIKKVGTESLYVGKTADYTITVTNTGENELHQVTIVDNAPDGSYVIDAPGSSWDCHGACWCLDILAPGETQVFNISMGRDCTGVTCDTVYVSSCEGACSQGSFETEWRGYPALSIEVVDECDPICTGDYTCYTLQIKNQGTAADYDIQITARFSDELIPSEVDGSTHGEIAGQAIMFDAMDSLYPGEYLEYSIWVKGVRPGDGRIRVDIQSRLLEKPAIREEITHVY